MNGLQAVIDIAEDFLVRMCGAAKLLAEHRSTAEAAQSAAAAPGTAPPARGTIEVKDFKLYLSRHAGMEVTDFDEQRWVDTLATKLADEKRALQEAAAREAAARAAQAAAVAKKVEEDRAAAVAKMAADAAASQAAAAAQAQVAAANGQTAAPGQDQLFNAERQRQMEAQVRFERTFCSLLPEFCLILTSLYSLFCSRFARFSGASSGGSRGVVPDPLHHHLHKLPDAHAGAKGNTTHPYAGPL